MLYLFSHLYPYCTCRFRPSIGECLAAFAGAFPVAFLEPHLNKNNPNSVLGQFELKGLDDRRGLYFEKCLHTSNSETIYASYESNQDLTLMRNNDNFLVEPINGSFIKITL